MRGVLVLILLVAAAPGMVRGGVPSYGLKPPVGGYYGGAAPTPAPAPAQQPAPAPAPHQQPASLFCPHPGVMTCSCQGPAM